jgi:hypothetical protein
MKLTIILLLITSSTVIAQNDAVGFFGRRLFIDVNALGAFPLIGNITNNPDYRYKNVDGNLIAGMDLFDYGYRIEGSYAIRKNIALGVELGQDYSNLAIARYIEINPVFDYWSDPDPYSTKILHEMLDIKSFSVIPKIELSSPTGIAPIGLNHQIGLGISFVRVANRDYLIEEVELNSDDLPFETAELYNFNTKSIKSICVLYGLNTRTPISKRVLFNYGIRYTINLTPKNALGNNSSEGLDEEYWLSRENMVELVRGKIFTSFIFLNLGFTIAIKTD